jgi:hypothetical protein
MDVQTISVVIAAASVVIGVINSILSSRRAEKNDQQMLETRQAELFANIYNRWTARDFSRTYVNYRYHYDIREHSINEDGSLKHPSTYPLDIHTDWQMLAAYFEGIGVLVQEGLLGVDLVEKLFSGRIIAIWERLFPEGAVDQDQIQEARELIKDPGMHDHFEYLYHEMKHRQRLTARPQTS